MSTKTHLTRQEEHVDEVGIQLREADPVSPTAEQVWLNTAENRLKAKVNNVIRVYYDAHSTTAVEIPFSGIVDGNLSYNHFMELLQETDFTFQNFFDGTVVRILLENNQSNSYRSVDVTLPSASVMNPGNYWAINSASNVEKFHVWYDFNGSGVGEPVIANSTPVRIEMTAGRRAKVDLTVKSPAGNSSAGMFEYVKIFNALNTEYYVWWNVDSFGGNPFPGSAFGIMVSIASSNDANTVATLTAQAINNAGFGFTASVASAVVTIENDQNGLADAATPQDGSMNMVQSITNTVLGANPNTATEIASLTSAALAALPEFSATSSGPVVSIVYADYGSSDAVQNIDIPTGFSSIVTAPGSGPVNVNWPSEAKFAGATLPNVVPSNNLRLYEFVKMGTNTIGKFTDY